MRSDFFLREGGAGGRGVNGTLHDITDPIHRSASIFIGLAPPYMGTLYSAI